MDFIKLFDLCRTGKLYFPSAHSLREQDPFEGSYTLYHSKYQLFSTAGGPEIKSWMTERHVLPSDMDEKRWRFLQDVNLDIRKNLGRYMFINSWHMAEDESLAMWKLYNPSGYGIAMVSGFTRLSDSIKQNDQNIYIGKLTYVDYETEDKWLGNSFDPFMHKHRAFMHEKEVRAVVWDKGFQAYWRNAHKEIAAKYDLPPPKASEIQWR
jgi:hypothetical protein